VRCRSSLQPSH